MKCAILIRKPIYIYISTGFIRSILLLIPLLLPSEPLHLDPKAGAVERYVEPEDLQGEVVVDLNRFNSVDVVPGQSREHIVGQAQSCRECEHVTPAPTLSSSADAKHLAVLSNDDALAREDSVGHAVTGDSDDLVLSGVIIIVVGLDCILEAFVKTIIRSDGV
jgi:hypothetical protein